MTPSESTSLATPPAKKPVQAHGLASTFVAQALVLGLGALTGILTARMLGPTGRGEYAAIFLWPLCISYIASFGMSPAIAFHIARKSFTLSEVTTATAVIGVVQGAVSILAGLTAIHFALARYSPEVRRLGDLVVLCTPTVIFGTYAGNLFQGKQDLFRFNLLRVASPAAYAAGLTAILLTHRGSLRLVVFALIAGYVAAFFLGAGTVRRQLELHWQWNELAIPGLLNYGYRTLATNLANLFNQRVDQLVLTLLVPPQELGLYAVAVTLSSGVLVFSMASGLVTFSRGSSQQGSDARLTIYRSFRMTLLWMLSSCAALYLLAPILVRLLFGTAFHGSVLACRILLPGTLMVGLNQILYNGANALGRPGLPSVAEGISMAVTAGGLYLLAPRYGYLGAAIVSSIAYTVSFLAMLVLSQRMLGLSLPRLLFASRRR
jgi:O-antigen/teichoic acid export membrane protein